MWVWYVDEVYTAKLSGSTAVSVRCEKCDKKFYYPLKCTATGRGSAPYGVGAERAKRLAQQMAKERLEWMLETDVAPVPCPRCGWYQEKMIPKLRRPRLERLRLFGLISGGIGGVLAALAGLVTLAYVDRPGMVHWSVVLLAWVIALSPLLSGVAALIVRQYRNATYDPNDPETEQERIELGCKLAISKEEAEAMM
jgi:hypothetical protein